MDDEHLPRKAKAQRCRQGSSRRPRFSLMVTFYNKPGDRPLVQSDGGNDNGEAHADDPENSRAEQPHPLQNIKSDGRLTSRPRRMQERSSHPVGRYELKKEDAGTRLVTLVRHSGQLLRPKREKEIRGKTRRKEASLGRLLLNATQWSPV